MILILGASGELATLTANALKALGNTDPVRLGSRSVDRLNTALGQAVFADYDQPDSLDAAMEGVDKVLFISGNTANDARLVQHLNVIAAAKKAGISQLVYTSFQSPSLDSAFSFGASHAATEAAIRAAAIPATVVRNAFYAELQLMGLSHTLETGVLTHAAAEGRFAPVSKQDLAEALARILMTDGHRGKTYELTGPELLSHADIAALIGKLSGKDISTNTISAEAQVDALLQMGLPVFLAKALGGASRAIAAGEYDKQSDDLARLLGRAPTRLAAVIEGALKPN
ncbi:NmrA family NAD(P)-binding protein [Shewanella litorisediminis]|uniref:NmrA family NAD(P)-binding protein n=1 Tax=Shewanella litorisediminis TaxID=1173586 RepID=A0ABX7G3D0_9GAMM|nr:NmrA family NAD(P)-binding protein [Shewanella litorisediminis]MCL2917290.1 NmrA family NAD(P)-binding protein [Shewanella litorisediminis]QRH01760.1 NmrA family NAD(P)-binding protein [Shewanella litorisediminis]